MKIITRVVEHLIIDTDPHLGMSLALLFTPLRIFSTWCSHSSCFKPSINMSLRSSLIISSAISPVQTFTKFNRSWTWTTLFRCYFPGSFLFNYFTSQLLHFIIVQHGFQFVHGRFCYLNWIRFTPHLLC